MLAPPPRSTFLAKNHCKLQGIMKHPLFTTLLAMVLNTAFLLQRCRKLLENHGACRPIVCQPPCSSCVSPSSSLSSLSVLPCGSPLARSVPVLLVSPLSPCLLSLSSPAALLSPRSLGPCAPCVWIWVWSCLVVWFSRRFLENKKNLRENQHYQRKPKKTNKTFGKTQQKQSV